MRWLAPVTSAALGISGVGNAPLGIASEPAGTAVLFRPHLGAHHVASRHPGTPGDRASTRALGAPNSRWRCARREAEIGLLQPLDLVAQPRGLLEFEIGRGGAHTLFEVGDDRF